MSRPVRTSSAQFELHTSKRHGQPQSAMAFCRVIQDLQIDTLAIVANVVRSPTTSAIFVDD